MKSMSIPGLLIEYIINGTVAYVWILLILSNFPLIQNLLAGYSNIIVLLAIPCAYVIGMVIDMIAYRLVKKSKTKIKESEINDDKLKEVYSDAEKEELNKLANEGNVTDKLVIELNIENIEGLINEINWRSSRDRIARGFIVNSFLIGLATTFSGSLWFWSCYESDILGLSLVIFIGITASIFIAYIVRIIWKNCEKLSTRFQFLTYIKVIKKRNLLS